MQTIIMPPPIAGTAPWTPLSISGCKLWAAARLEVGLSDGDAVETWTDQSGLGNNLTQATAGNKPIYKTAILNGHPIIRFDGTDDHFTLANVLSGASAGEVFLVVKIDNDPPGNSNQSGLWNMDGDGTNICHFPWTNGNIYEAWGRTTRVDTGNPTPSLASWRLYNVSSAAGAFTTRIDGTQHYTTASSTFSSFSGTPYFGRSNAISGNAYLDGDVAELIIYNSVLSAGDRDDVESYLATLYGLTIA